MATRQTKKRKARNNANNRERTVTTLTEDPHTHYLVPTPSEEPAGSHMPVPFAASASGKLHNMPMSPQAYQMTGNFGFGYAAPFGSMQHTNMHQNNQHQQQQPYFSPPQGGLRTHMQAGPQSQQPRQPQDRQTKPALPPGRNDLEILQNLKKLIIDGQHPFYTAIPRPDVLIRLYKGPLSSQSQTDERRSDQGPSERRNDSTDFQHSSVSTAGFVASGGDGGRRQPRMQGKDRRGLNAAEANQQANNISQPARNSRFSQTAGSDRAPNLNLGGLKIGKDSSGPPSAGLQPEPRSPDLAAPPAGFSTGSSTKQNMTGSHWPERYDTGQRSHVEPDSDAVVGGRSGHGGSAYDNARSSDVTRGGEDSMYIGKDGLSRSGSWAPRTQALEEHYADINHPRTPQPSDFRSVGGVDRGTGPLGHISDNIPKPGVWGDPDLPIRRPPQDEARVSRLTDSRRPSAASESRPLDAEFVPPPHAVHRAPVEAAVPPDARRPADTRPPANPDSYERPIHMSDIPSSARDSDAIRPPVDSHAQPDVRPDPRPAPSRPDVEDVPSSRASPVRPSDASAPLGSAPPPAESVGSSDDPSMRPSLKDRMDQPSQQQPRLPGQAVGESHPPQDRFKGRKFQKNYYGGPSYNGAPKGDRNFSKPPGPSDGPPPSSGGQGPPRSFRARSPSVDSRKLPPSPGSRGPPPRDYRGPPGRDISRERAGGYSRPDFNDARPIDADGPPPARYEGRSYSDFPPPPSGDRNRPNAYPPSPPLSGGRGPPGSDMTPGRGDYYAPYTQDRHDWDSGEDPYYKARQWERPPPPVGAPTDRERFERDYPPARAGSWDARTDREFVARDGYPGGPPDDRYPPGPPPPREADRGRPPPAGYSQSYSRVRGRSPSPLGRPGPVPVDSGRPPLKRPREDFASDYYAGGRPPVRRPPPPGEYPPPPPPPPRSASQAPSSADWPPPTSGSSAGTMGNGPPGDRDYRMGRQSMDYGAPGSYDRPRSPPGPPGRNPYGGRGGYGRGGDRGGYGMRPPQ